MVDQEEKEFINAMCQESGPGLVERLRAEIAALHDRLSVADQMIDDLLSRQQPQGRN